MTEFTRAEVAAGQRDIRHDAKLERRLVPKALLAIVLVVAIAIVRELLLR